MVAISELRELDEEELEGRLNEYRRELLNLRFQLGTGALDNVSRVSQVRKDVARVLTVLRDRDLAEVEGREPVRATIETLPRRRPRKAAPAEEELPDDEAEELDDDEVEELEDLDELDEMAELGEDEDVLDEEDLEEEDESSEDLDDEFDDAEDSDDEEGEGE